MAGLILTAAFGLGLGGIAAGALALMPPFSRHDAPAWETAAVLGALIGLCATAGAFVLDGWAAGAVAAGATAAGGALFWWWAPPRGSVAGDWGHDPERLGVGDLRRAKEEGDCWVLVTGAPGAGKTALIGRMIAEAHHSMRLAAPPRRGAHRELRATELTARRADGSARRLRLWEHTWDAGLPAQPARGDIAGVALVIDGTGVSGTADSFPPAVRTGDAIDANARALAVAEWLPRERPVWLVVTKADLLRLSIDPGLVGSVKVGPDWNDQLRGLDPVRRDGIARAIGVTEQGGETAAGGTAAFERGQGSPFLAYAGRGDAGEGAFGGAELLRAIVDTLAPDMKERAIGH